MTAQEHVSLALLAGGRSRRMGRDKAFAEFAGQTLIERLRDLVAPGFAHVCVVTKETARYRDLGLPVIADVRPEDSPTVGVYSAVLASPTPRVLCLGVDLPFVTRGLLERLAALSEPYEAFVPRDGSGLQPLCAVYGRQTLPALELMLDQDERRLDRVFERVRTGYLDVRRMDLGDPNVLFVNVNTPADLAQARRRAQDGGGIEPPGAGGDGRGAGGSTALDLAPRVVDFMRRTPLPTVSFVGKKKSGKTTVLAGVIAELTRRGRRVAAIKSDQHGFSIDVPGTDSHTLREAGADVTLVASPEHVAMMSRVPQPVPLLGLVWRLREPLDIVLTEGFARQPAPKIEVSRAARSHGLIAPCDELLAIVSDRRFPDYPVPRLALDDVRGIADVLESVVARHRRRSGAASSEAPGAALAHDAATGEEA